MAGQDPEFSAGPPGEMAVNLPRLALGAGGHRIDARVARSNDRREQGLMHREALDADEGMLFVYGEPVAVCMWMKDTPVPLAIAFIGEDGCVVNIDEMQADSTESHCAAAPVRFVLEMRAGWFAEHGVKAGDRVEGLPI